MILPDSGISVGITDSQVPDYKGTGGEGGIRTPGTLSGTPVFKTGAINHSATSPELLLFYYRTGAADLRSDRSRKGGPLPQPVGFPALLFLQRLFFPG